MSRLLDWDVINTVLLDMDGTLLDLHFDNYFWQEHVPLRYAELHQMPLEDSRRYLTERISSERGTLNWYCLDYWTDVLALDIVALKGEVADRIAVLPGVLEFLGACRDAGKRVVLVTNAHRGSLDLKMERTRLAGHLDEIYCSHDFGRPKEDRAFWEALRQVEPFDPRFTVLVDDSLAVLDSARDYGIAKPICVVKPDSRSPARQDLGYPAIESFADLLPIHSR